MIHEEKVNSNENKKVTEISIIAPTVELAQKTLNIIVQRNENINVFVPMLKEDALSDGLRIARSLVDEGAMVLISRKGMAAAINEAKLDVPIVAIDVLVSDYIEAIETAKDIEGTTAFFSYEKIIDDVKSICRLLNIDAKYYTFKTDKDCEVIVKQALAEGVVLGIGGVITQKYADKYGLRHITIENSEETINNAINTAKQILQIQKEELKKQKELKIQLERYKAVLSFTHDAIIANDENGIIGIIEPVADAIAKGNFEYKIGKNASEIKRVLQKDLIAKYNFEDIKGESKELKDAIAIAKSYASSESTILIRGETGTGKELFAQSIHNLSSRKNGPFVAINCASLSSNLLEAELFGCVEDTFTGAVNGEKIGLFELAHKGTIFLDEIGEIPIEIQAQLLSVLQEKEIRKVGSTISISIDVRVITATNSDLITAIKDKTFREDLYYRIGVLNLCIPPLRDRKDDIVILSKFFFKRSLGENYVSYIHKFNEIMDKVKDYKWYGNIREFQNFIERICVLLKYHGNSYNFNQLIDDMLVNNDKNQVNHKTSVLVYSHDIDKDLNNWETYRIMNALKNNGLNIQKTADELGISRTTLWRKMKKYNLSI